MGTETEKIQNHNMYASHSTDSSSSEIMQSKDIVKQVMKHFGTAKIKTTDKDNKKTRTQVSKELLEKYDKQFSVN